MIRIRLALFAVFTLLVLSACNTVEGVGKDIKSAGGAIESAGNG
jgi:entericidin B